MQPYWGMHNSFESITKLDGKKSFYGTQTTIMYWKLATRAPLKSLAAHTQKKKNT